MKNLSLLVLALMLGFNVFAQNEKSLTITISGQAIDFEGQPIDSCLIDLKHSDFSSAYSTYTDENGYYTLENVEKGRYVALFAMRPKEYPRSNAVPEEDMRLEFWAWNVVADRDLIINPRYHKLEVYGTNVFQVLGGYPGLFVYFRPMGVTRYISYQKEDYLDKKRMEEKAVDISVRPEYLDVKIFADNELLKINSITPVEEYAETMSITGYIVQVEVPKEKSDKPYIVFRIEAENKEFNEKGEGLYFYELKNYK